MRIDQDKCIGCMKCIPFCCNDAIIKKGDKCVIDEDECVECGVCKRSEICPVDAFQESDLKWPRILRRAYSAVDAAHDWMGVDGRGTMEMKTNDVTGAYRYGEVGFTVDVGRPGVTASFEDVEKIAMAVAKVGVVFDKLNPATALMADTSTGKFRDDIKKERILSCIIEFKTDESAVPAVVNALKEAARKVDTVFSVGCISRCDPEGKAPVQAILDKAGIFYRPNAKINIGLGRPLAEC